jgi:hypothetical protein
MRRAARATGLAYPTITVRVFTQPGSFASLCDFRVESGLPLAADISGHGRYFAFVPTAEVENLATLLVASARQPRGRFMARPLR